MPSGALTFPASVFLLACLAWPAWLAARDHGLFPSGPTERAAFFALAIAGAPVSAWAAFVVGSRRGRSRKRAGWIGLSVAVLFFLPTWAWAGLRYARLKTAPFSIESVMIGEGGKYAFLNLVRHPSLDPISAAGDGVHYTAAVLNLEDGSWRLAGHPDQSAFVPERAYQRNLALTKETCERLRLVQRGKGGEYEAWDGATGRPIPGPLKASGPPDEVTPADFGLDRFPPSSRLRWAGLGQRLLFRDEAGRLVGIYRDPRGDLWLNHSAIVRPKRVSAANSDVRVRNGAWLVAETGLLQRLDLTSGVVTDTGCLKPGERIGPSMTDGRVVLVGERELWMLDPDTCGRTPIRILPEHGSICALVPRPWGSPVSSNSPSVVAVHFAKGLRGIALLDPASSTLHLPKANRPSDLELLGAVDRRALALEAGRRILSYDFGRRPMGRRVHDRVHVNGRAPINPPRSS